MLTTNLSALVAFQLTTNRKMVYLVRLLSARKDCTLQVSSVDALLEWCKASKCVFLAYRVVLSATTLKPASFAHMDTSDPHRLSLAKSANRWKSVSVLCIRSHYLQFVLKVTP